MFKEKKKNKTVPTITCSLGLHIIHKLKRFVTVYIDNFFFAFVLFCFLFVFFFFFSVDLSLYYDKRGGRRGFFVSAKYSLFQ